jgi:hypothetical protein
VDATAAPSQDQEEEEDEDLRAACGEGPQQALEKLSPNVPWDALITCCSNVSSDDYETRLSAFQLVDRACAFGDASIAAAALVDVVQKSSTAILDEEYSPPRLVEAVAGALRNLAEASPAAAQQLDAAPVVRRLLRDSPIMRPQFLGDATRFLRRCGLVRALRTLQDASASVLASPTYGAASTGAFN